MATLTEEQVTGLAQEFLEKNYPPSCVILSTARFKDPPGTYFVANAPSEADEQYVGDGGFFVHRETSEIWHFGSGQLLYGGLEEWLSRYETGWRPGFYRVRLASPGGRDTWQRLRTCDAWTRSPNGEGGSTWVPGTSASIRKQLRAGDTTFLIAGSRYPDLVATGLHFDAEYLGDDVTPKMGGVGSPRLLWWIHRRRPLPQRMWRYLKWRPRPIRITLRPRDE